ALLEVNPKRRLTASQTLQHDWLQHATSQKDHKGAIKATDSTSNQQKLSRQLESGENKSDSHKPEIFKRLITWQATNKMHPMQWTPPPPSNIPQISTNLRNQHSKKTLTQNMSDLLSN
ncbi:hypothetical protein M9458_038180, partial [Cirrhinus mrigala]